MPVAWEAVARRNPQFIILLDYQNGQGPDHLERVLREHPAMRLTEAVRNGRFIVPIQARARIPAPYRAAFDYHCRLEMPGDPIPAEVRKDCTN